MPTLCSLGSPITVISDAQLVAEVQNAYRQLGARRRVLAVPPDFTRLNSRAGLITRATHDHFRDALTDILPALGTHVPMPAWQIDRMYPGIPHDRFRIHDWRNDVITVGTLEAEFVSHATDGIYDRPWPAQLNRLIVEGGHDLILSIGQVVPHEVTGMANHAKNLFVGCGGKAGIDESHFIGAVYGMERMMGRADTPVRRLLNEALRRFLSEERVLFVLTVVGAAAPGEAADHAGLVTRGLFIGTGTECFEQACTLSLQVNFELLEEEPETIVCHLDPEEFPTTWLGNKSVYRTRMAIRTGGELIVLAPGLRGFGEDPAIDRLIREHGYRPSAEILRRVRDGSTLNQSLSAAAHLIHGSSEDRFTVTYCPGHLTQAEIESVGYRYADLPTMQRRYDPTRLTTGWNTVDGKRIYYIPNPALGLWAYRGRF